MVRNSKKIFQIDTATLGVVSGTCGKGFAATSLMTLGLVPLQAIDHPSLGYAQCEPILHVLLERDVELGSQFLWFFGDRLPAGKLHLKGKLAYQRLMLAPRTPQGDIALGDLSF